MSPSSPHSSLFPLPLSDSDLQFVTLSDRPQWLPDIAAWHHYHWPEEPLSARAQKLQEHLKPGALPLTLILMRDQQLLGSGSLIPYERLGGFPAGVWLANLFIVPEQRQQGLGSLLVQALQRLAKRWGEKRLYLSTTDQAHFYSRLGWGTVACKTFKGEPTTIMRRDLD